DPWDGILYGYPEAKKWYPGSSFRQRSAALAAPLETAAPGTLVHMAAVYHADNSIQLYRNGQPYGQTVVPRGPNSNLQRYERGSARVCLGAGQSGEDPFVGEIEEARLYGEALSAAQVQMSFETGHSRGGMAPANSGK